MKAVGDIRSFIETVEAAIDAPVALALEADTPLRDIRGWDSLRALIVVAALQEDYGVAISEREFTAARTLGELYALVRGKQPQAD